MADNIPDYLIRGEQARLFPVLSMTSKEGRTTSIVLAILTKVSELRTALFESVGKRVGVQTKIETYTEVAFKNNSISFDARPDGLIVLKRGKDEWRALVEAKIGKSDLEVDQIERYRQLAKENEIDCIITISNQFATLPHLHPLPGVQKSRSKVPVYHWSWMYILTETDLLINQDKVADTNQRILLYELRRFLSHESTGVKGFDRMPKEWSEINKLVSSGGLIPARSSDAAVVLSSWHQETRDLALILCRLTGTVVTERLSKRHRRDSNLRYKDGLSALRKEKQLTAFLEIPDAAAPLEIVVDVTRRSIDVGMTLRAPENRVSSRARINWALRQIRSENVDDLHLRLLWPGRNEPTQHNVSELRADVTIAEIGKEHLAPYGFHIFNSKSLGSRFAQQANFISDLEECVPAFYREIGSSLTAWKKSAPKIKNDRPTASDVSASSISENSDDYRAPRT